MSFSDKTFLRREFFFWYFAKVHLSLLFSRSKGSISSLSLDWYSSSESDIVLVALRVHKRNLARYACCFFVFSKNKERTTIDNVILSLFQSYIDFSRTCLLMIFAAKKVYWTFRDSFE